MHPTRIYLRSEDAAVASVRELRAATANPQSPNEVLVSRPSDALAARDAANATFTSLLLGLRRSLGATRGQIRLQFLAESLLLSALGGAGGVVLGIARTTGYAAGQAWPAVVPAWATAGGLAATLPIGVMAGLYPAIQAARLAPTEALSAPG